MRRMMTVILGSLLLQLPAAAGVRAQPTAESCLAMRLALLGATVSTELHCQAWSVATRTPPSDACVAYAENDLSRRLREAGCASDEEIATLLELASASTDALVGSQVAKSRLAEFEDALWSTEAIVDFGRTYEPGMPWPDTSCRASGHCADLHIVACDTTASPDGTLATECKSAPESRSPERHVPGLQHRERRAADRPDPRPRDRRSRVARDRDHAVAGRLDVHRRRTLRDDTGLRHRASGALSTAVRWGQGARPVAPRSIP